jgi:hypothetical protein
MLVSQFLIYVTITLTSAFRELRFSKMISRLTNILSFLVCIFSPQTLAQLGVERGLSFTRNIDEIPGSFDLLFDGHPCNDQDEHGDNDCHFEWGADVTGGYKLYIDRDIDEGDSMTGHFKVRNDAI